VIEIFGHIKRLGRSVCLLIANQWATTTRHAEDAGQYKELATRCGLRVGEEIAFISDLGYTEGLPQRMMRELGALGNLFVFPTREESFGLVLPEAVLSGGALPVLNASLDMQREVSGGHALFFDFGSNRRAFEPSDWTGYLRDVARIILGRMDQSEALRARTLVRQRYNMDRLYLEAYSPLLAEARTWKEERCASAA